MTASLQAPNACSKATSCRILSIGFLQLACITGVIFLRFAGERRPAQCKRGARDTRDWGRRVSGASCSLTLRTLDISLGVVGIKRAVLGGTLVLASTDLASSSLSWILSLLELSLDLSSNSLSKSTLFHTSVGLSSTPAVLFLEKELMLWIVFSQLIQYCQ